MSMRLGSARTLQAEINVTPFADIMIVLLIIFMIATSAMDKDDRFRLPRATHAQEPDKSPLIVKVTREGKLLLGESPLLDAGMLEMMLGARLGEQGLVQLQADDGLDYARVAPVLAAMRAAGAAQIVIRTQPTSQTRRNP